MATLPSWIPDLAAQIDQHGEEGLAGIISHYRMFAAAGTRVNDPMFRRQLAQLCAAETAFIFIPEDIEPPEVVLWQRLEDIPTRDVDRLQADGLPEHRPIRVAPDPGLPQESGCVLFTVNGVRHRIQFAKNLWRVLYALALGGKNITSTSTLRQVGGLKSRSSLHQTVRHLRLRLPLLAGQDILQTNGKSGYTLIGYRL